MVFPKLKNKVMSNKTSQGVGITYIVEALVPREYGMEITKHQNPISYGKLILIFFSYFVINCFKFFLFIFCNFAFDYKFEVIFCNFLHVFYLHGTHPFLLFYKGTTKMVSTYKIWRQC